MTPGYQPYHTSQHRDEFNSWGFDEPQQHSTNDVDESAFSNANDASLSRPSLQAQQYSQIGTRGAELVQSANQNDTTLPSSSVVNAAVDLPSGFDFDVDQFLADLLAIDPDEEILSFHQEFNPVHEAEEHHALASGSHSVENTPDDPSRYLYTSQTTHSPDAEQVSSIPQANSAPIAIVYGGEGSRAFLYACNFPSCVNRRFERHWQWERHYQRSHANIIYWCPIQHCRRSANRTDVPFRDMLKLRSHVYKAHPGMCESRGGTMELKNKDTL
ncbi:hypothetical protein P153DRAFT_94779 [Dothidotthia symphoricarpi CBS 119687]|uniref:Uncharacterized protein n=1 Tax=Dothidotthia symphoricarpi CBS 119687 TaxID=1392245 RepID=A0A6A6A1X5_9PLEO|nr:uncharacterized protein P153DRAFT_94779 [Dothidotthia symphoricarpi CBS 119687]KAF2125839.1 hypothetical protein P153DRAFT_94779 [Dothidotthia symphoricarpi CBS 119687]